MRRAWFGALVAGAAATAGCAKGSELDSGARPTEVTAPSTTTTTTGTTDPSTTALTTTTTGPVTDTDTTTDTSESTGSQMTTDGPRCGDGTVDPGEACDDGNLVNSDACTNACALATCGDGFVLAGVEECDDGNQVDGDGCTNACTLAVCGDGVVHLGIEACDDGNADDSDACTSECALAGCGDGILMMGVEECDDGNAVNTDACTASCKHAVCGDGILWLGVEECEDGNQIAGDGCEPDCKKTLVNKYTAYGPKVNVPVASVVGWEVCYSDTFDHEGTAMSTILQQCSKANLMLACREVGSDTYALLAHGPREQVTQDTLESDVPTVANGAGWYYSDAHSWGFAGQGDTIKRTPCDTSIANPERRLCFHTAAGAIDGGFRCGTKTHLNHDSSWERVILHAD